MATKTSTHAQANVPAKAVHAGKNWVTGQETAGGCLSASADGVLLLAKLPVGAKNVQIAFDAIHTGATGAKLKFGIVRNGSVTASALLTKTDIAVTNRTAWAVGAPYSPDWDAYTGGAAYVQCSNASGTISQAFVLNYQVSYDF